MPQPRQPQCPGGDRIAPKARPYPDPVDPGLDEVGNGREDWMWLQISEEEREALLKETDIYLAELAEKVGEPSAKHIARAQVLLDQLNGARATEAPA